MADTVQRRLAAILAADVAGYSRLIGEDEAGTRAQFNARLDAVVGPALNRHQGRLVKTMGDGFLVEFPSVLGAVQAAADIQSGSTRLGRDEPANRRMEFRIGIHLGDVIVEGHDIHGEGVNIAARLEALADPGGLCVSEVVHSSVRNKLELRFANRGEQSLKNIAEPVRVFALQSDWPGEERASTDEALFRRPAVAVLPFENLSGDPEQEYFADGLTEDIITALSLWKSFPVIARNSTFAYKGESPDIRKVGEELGARYVIEGSVRKSGDRVRVTAQLINAETGHHVWAERFDRHLADIFDLQDELTERIAATVAPEVERVERRRAVEARHRDLDAWEFVQRGMALLEKFTAEENERAREMFRRALDLAPGYVDAYTGIAWSNIRDLNSIGMTEPVDSKRQITAAARKAVESDRTDAYAHLVLSIGYQMLGEHDRAIEEVEMAVDLNPNSANGHVTLGHQFALVGRSEEAIAHLEKGLTLNPKDPRNHLFYGFMARAHLTARTYDKAEQWARKAISWNTDAPMARLLLVASLGHLGRVDDARTELETLRRTRPDYLANPSNWHSYKFAEDEENLLDGLRMAGWEG